MAKVLSIEISDSVIRMCQMDYKKKNPRVYRHAMIETPQGAYRDGRVLKPEILKDVIVDSLKENKMYGTKDVVFSIASSKIVTREVMLPPVKEKMIPNMIKANLSEYFPIDLTAYEVAHLVLEKIEEGADAGKYKVMIMAAEKSMVASYDNLATSCGLRLSSLDYAGNSIFQAIRNEDESSRVMVLKIEEKSTTVTIVNHKNLMLQRAINYGINDAIDEMTKQRVFGVNNYDEAWNLAKRKACIKYWVNEDAQRTSVDLSTRMSERDFDESQEIREAKIEVTRSLDQLISSIRRVVEFYSSRNNGETVDQVLVCGCAGDINGLARLLSNELGIKTSVMNRMEGIGWHVVGDDAGIHNYVSCIGASLNPIGFYTKEKKAAGAKVEKDYTVLTVVMLIAILLAGAGMVGLGYMQYKEAKDEEARLQALKAEYEPAQAVYTAYTNMKTLYEQMKAGDAKTVGVNDNILLFLEELENTLPATVELTSFVSDDEKVEMNMLVEDKETAAGVIANIRNMSSLMSVSVPNIMEVSEKMNAEDYAMYLYKKALLENSEAVKEAGSNESGTEATETTETLEGITDELADALGLTFDANGELIHPDNFVVPASMVEMDEDAELPENASVTETGEIMYEVKYISFSITGIYYPASVTAVE